ncbi:MAG: hypothetical protein U0531_15095 [Dehalococcoidia bacterium]
MNWFTYWPCTSSRSRLPAARSAAWRASNAAWSISPGLRKSTNSATPGEPQFRTGESPLRADIAVMPVVPKVRKKSAVGLTKSFSSALTICSVGLSWCMIVRLELTTIAFSFFEPITAPTPERAASRPRSLQTPEMSDSDSPAGPIRATEQFLPVAFLPYFS